MKRFNITSSHMLLGDLAHGRGSVFLAELPVIPGTWLAERRSDSFIVMNEEKFRQFPQIPEALSMLLLQIPTAFLMGKGPFAFADAENQDNAARVDLKAADFTVHGIRSTNVDPYYAFIIKLKTNAPAEDDDTEDSDEDESDDDE